MNAASVGHDVLQQKMCISGDPGKRVEFAQSYVDKGFDHIIFTALCRISVSSWRPTAAKCYHA